MGRSPRAGVPRRIAHLVGLAILATVAAGCWAEPPITPTPAPLVSTAAPAHAPEIRFGLVGELAGQNVWALYAGQDYSYNDYAIRSAYWPRLFGILPPDRRIQPLAASTSPGPITQEGAYYTGTVELRDGLRWSDGTALSAGDVAFTVNAALEFELDFDWRAFYDPDVLDHAETLTASTVKFYFKRPPGIEAWQYGALQGPVVQAAYWASKIAVASEALPPQDIRANIEALRDRVAALQQEADALYAATFTAAADQLRPLQAELKRKQGSLDEAINDLDAAEAGLKESMNSARSALFAQDDADEPLLGGWLPEDVLSANPREIVSIPNANYPLPSPNFDRLVHRVYPTRAAAQTALNEGEINLILDPQSPASAASPGTLVSPTRSTRFLLLNVASAPITDAALRQALACVLDQEALAAALNGQAVPRTSYVAAEDGEWTSDQALLPCAGLDNDGRLAQAVQTLKTAGYTWDAEPSAAAPGQALKLPDGALAPDITLLASSSDAARVAAANYVQRRAAELGLSVAVELVTPEGVNYAVLSSGEFDLAVVGWQLGAFPGYLCDWYAVGGVLHYDPTPLTGLCGQLGATSDLDEARRLLGEIQQTLARELPLIPLYSPVIVEQPRGVSYPFESLHGGLVEWYGAPNFAVPDAQ